MKKYFLLSLLFLLSPVGASAFTLSPTKIDLTIDAGSVQIVEVDIKNDESGVLGFKPVVMGVEQTEQGNPKFVTGASEVESWAIVKAEDFTLAPGQEKKVQFSIDVPSGSYPGSYYLGLGAQQINGQNGEVSLSGRLLTLVNIKVAGVANEELRSDKWQSTKKVWLSPNWNFVSLVTNKGNVELPLKGELVIYNFFGRQIASKELLLGNEIIPGTLRSFDINFSLPSKYVFLPGRYQAGLVLNYGLTNQKIILSTDLWYFYPPTIFLFIVLIFLPVLFVLTKKLFFSKRK